MAVGVKEYLTTIEYISRLYDFLNEKLFNGELIKPVITIHPNEKDKPYAWTTQDKLWKENENDEGMYELNISAQHLKRSIMDIANTLIHEMCHQWAKVNNFQDTLRSGSVHNKLFLKIAIMHGLKVEYVRGRGWSETSLREETVGLIQDFINKNPPTLVYRELPLKVKRVRDVSTYKYICCSCKIRIRATKSVCVICGTCMQEMQEEK